MRRPLAPAAALVCAAVVVAVPGCARRGLGEWSQAEAVALLRSRGVPFEAEEFLSRARRNDLETVTAFLAGGIDPDANGGKALAMAAAGGRDEMMELLLEAGADPDRASGSFGQTALVTALMRGSLDQARILLEAGADPDAPTRAGATALLFAQNVEMTRLLLDAGASVDWRDRSGVTPLMGAVVLGDVELVELLLERGADPAAVDLVGRSPMLLATVYRFSQIEERLLAAGAPPLPRVRLPDSTLETYAGRYGRQRVEYQVLPERGRLFLIPQAGSGTLYENELVPLTETVFYRDGDPGAVLYRFELEAGRVVGLSHPWGDGRVWVPRID